MEPDDVDADTVVVVEADEETDTPVVETGDTTVIVETPPDDAGEELDPFTERFVRLETRVDALEAAGYSKPDYSEVVNIAEDAAEDALESALEVDEQIIAATDEAIVETIEDATIEDVDDDGEDDIVVDEIAPVSARVHPLFRPLSDWKNN